MKLSTPLRLLLLTLGTALRADLPGDVNQDGVLNAADHAYVRAVVNRRVPATPTTDVDGDGEVTERDAAAVADLILGESPYLFRGAADLGPAGGQVSAGDLTLAVPAGALPVSAHLVVGAAPRESGFEGEDDSELYRIEGLPIRYGTGLTVSLPAASPGRAPARAGEVFLEIGEESLPRSEATLHLATRIVAPRLEGGRLVADLPPLDAAPVGEDEEVPDTQTIFVRRVTGVAIDNDEVLPDSEGTREGTPARIYYPQGMTKEQYQPVVDALVRANIELKRLGFSPSDRTQPVFVYLKKLDPAICGSYECSAWGVDYSFLDINLSYVLDTARLEALQRTVFHEYFHMIQARFDPRYALTQTKCVAPTLWFDEACSVWFERYAPLAGGEVSSVMGEHAHEVLAGHHVDSSGLAVLNQKPAARAQNHGYGLAMMLEFLFFHDSAPEATRGKANPALVTVYTAIRNGTAMRDAFLENMPLVTGWWDDLLATYVDGTIGRPAPAFRSAFTTAGARAKATKLTEAHTGTAPLPLSVDSLGDCESWAFSLNWQKLGAKDKRRLLVEIASPDNAVYSALFNSARNQTNPLAAGGTLYGKYGDSYVSWIATPMENTNNGLSIRPLHYLLLRHFGNPAASLAKHQVRIWYADAEYPVATKSMELSLDTEPKLLDYSLVGKATCEEGLVPHETLIYSDVGLSHLISRGGASFLVPNDGAIDVDIDVTLTATIDPESVYVIKRYRLRAYYIGKDGETRESILRTYASPGTSTNIRDTITLGANDQHVFISIYADEDFKPDALLNGVYSLTSSIDVGTLSRYETTLVSRYGAKEGTRGEPQVAPTRVCQTLLRQKDGTAKTATTTIHAASGTVQDRP